MKRGKIEKPPMELCDEAVFLLRRAPASVWTIYFLGTGPFLLALLYFWTDMTRGIFRESRLVSGALSLTALFVWMKTCQSIFASKLWSVMSGFPRAKLTAREWFRIAMAQSRLQPWGMLLIPVAAVLTIPFAWVFAYFQNATVLGAAPRGQSLHAISIEQMKLWPRQNNVGLAGISALGFIVCIDLLILLFMAPQILITFFGVKEVMHPSAWLLANTTFLALVFSLSYLIFDPLVKAFYTLRCYYGQSLTTGEDLRARLTMARETRPKNSARLARTAALLALLVGSLQAAEPAKTPTTQELNQSITETLKAPEYSWRFPREVVGEDGKRSSWLHSFLGSVGRWIGDVVEGFFTWLGNVLRRLFSRTPSIAPSNGSMFQWPSGKELLFLFLAAVVTILVVFLLKTLRFKKTGKKMDAVAAVPIPDLARDDVTADELPEDEWMALAAKLAGEGELRLAIRALFLSALSIMAGRQWIALARYKSNHEYEREFQRRAASLPQALGAFRLLTSVYNRIWYGLHEPSPELVSECQESVRILKS